MPRSRRKVIRGSWSWVAVITKQSTVFVLKISWMTWIYSSSVAAGWQ